MGEKEPVIEFNINIEWHKNEKNSPMMMYEHTKKNWGTIMYD